MIRLSAILLGILSLTWPASVQADTWTDAMGRSVELAGEPQRIVSLVPSVTEILYALGVEERLVGVTRFCTYPPQAKAKRQVGEYAEPNLEAVAALEPDLVILSADNATPALLTKIESLGMAVYVVYPKGVKETIDSIRALGELVGAAGAGERAGRQLQQAIEQVQAAVDGRDRPRVLFCVMAQPMVVAGPGTLIDDLIRIAGGRNLVPPGQGRYPTWGREALLAADPDVIVISSHPGKEDPQQLFAGWPELWAVRNKQIVTVEPDWVSRPGPRLALGAAALAEVFGQVAIQPEARGGP